VTRLVECVPNFSEGREPAVIATIAAAITHAGGRVLDQSLDAWHHRAVITFVAEPARIVDAAFAAIREARDRIDLQSHTGVHPRIGAADVVPFIPLGDVTMDECVKLARLLADRVGSELAIPAYLYEHAAQRRDRRNLADIRAGGLDGLRTRLATDVMWTPDAGPRTLHPSAGAVAIGTRAFLGAFNVYIGDASALADARAIARELRAANGGLPGLKALGLLVHDETQVSMNVTDLAATPLHRAFDAVDAAARARGRRAEWSELIGLLPQQVIEQAFADRVRLRDTRSTVSLEQRITATAPADDMTRAVEAIASREVHEASGSAAALAAMLASGTLRLAAGVQRARGATIEVDSLHRILIAADVLEQHLQQASRDDARAWQGVLIARRLPHGTDDEAGLRRARIDAALLGATDVPLRIARLATDLLGLATETAALGDVVTAPDVWTAASLAHGATISALGLGRANLALLSAPQRGDAASTEIRQLAHRASTLLTRARDAVGQIAG
jgi:glutamate formiminotransferase / formiminotetrahydrofolate cyclodeaminase